LLLAVVGPATWVCLTVTVLALTLIPFPLQITKAVVWLPVPLMPPFNATADQEVALVVPSATAAPPLVEGKSPMNLTLLLLASSDFAPPPSMRVFAGQVAVAVAIPPVVVGPETVLVTTWVWLIVPSVKHTAKGWTSKVPPVPPTPPYANQYVGSVAPLLD